MCMDHFYSWGIQRRQRKRQICYVNYNLNRLKMSNNFVHVEWATASLLIFALSNTHKSGSGPCVALAMFNVLAEWIRTEGSTCNLWLWYVDQRTSENILLYFVQHIERRVWVCVGPVGKIAFVASKRMAENAICAVIFECHAFLLLSCESPFEPFILNIAPNLCHPIHLAALAIALHISLIFISNHKLHQLQWKPKHICRRGRDHLLPLPCDSAKSVSITLCHSERWLCERENIVSCQANWREQTTTARRT